MCLLTLRRTKTLPLHCLCDSGVAYNAEVRETHGVANHSAADKELPKDVINMINYLTRHDAVLFRHAMERFLADLKTIEQATKLRIGCMDYDEMRKKVYFK